MRYARKTTPRVRDGRVQRKNHRDVSRPRGGAPLLRVEPPRPGYHHTISEPDLRRFVALLPDWEDLSVGLDEIVLTDHDEDVDGWYEQGSVYVCAWPDTPVVELVQVYYEEHREVLQQLGVRVGKPGWCYHGVFDSVDELELDETCDLVHTDEGVHLYERVFPCRFTPRQARAFQLLHILLHELGHHRGGADEDYAEAYALRHGRTLLERYRSSFGI
jgi:hypothetical protein